MLELFIANTFANTLRIRWTRWHMLCIWRQ